MQPHLNLLTSLQLLKLFSAEGYTALKPFCMQCVNVLADLSQFRLGCSALWEASVYKIYKAWVYFEMSCHSLLKKLKVLGTDAYIWLNLQITQRHSLPVRHSMDGHTFFLHQRHCYFCLGLIHESASATRL